MKTFFDSAAGGRSDALVSEMGPFKIGRNKAELEANATLQIATLGQEGSSQELLSRLKGRGAVCGTLEEVLEQVRAKSDAGIDRLYLQ